MYNHEKYLRDCLDGIVMQKTDFPYFAVVHDDCSNDYSADIIREYQRKYPDKILPIFEDVNCYSTDWHAADTKIHDAYGDAKYIAVCEGDDYWTNPYKLQKQVDFLESHPEYAMCAHETLMIDEHLQKCDLFSKIVCKNSIIPKTRTCYGFEDTLKGNIFHLSSLMFRQSDLIVFPNWRYRISAGDMIISRYLGSCGKTCWMPEVMSVYRCHAGSVTVSESAFNSNTSFYDLNILVLRLLNRFWRRTYQKNIYPIISRYYVESSMDYLRKSHRNWKESKRMAYLAWCYDKRTALRFIIKGLVSKLTSRLCRR